MARRYFEAINAHDLDGAVALWAAGGRENVRGQVDVTAPEGVRAFIGDCWTRCPTCASRSLDTTTEGERCARAVAADRHVRRTRARSTASRRPATR